MFYDENYPIPKIPPIPPSTLLLTQIRYCNRKFRPRHEEFNTGHIILGDSRSRPIGPLQSVKNTDTHPSWTACKSPLYSSVIVSLFKWLVQFPAIFYPGTTIAYVEGNGFNEPVLYPTNIQL